MPRPGDKPRTFRETLDAAIEDITSNGFDTLERIERWTRALRLAAERSLVSEKALEDQMREGLAAIYRRLVERGGVFRYNPGVERFTIDRVKPQLRAELDRRIMASANLIKLNRAEAIEKTLKRFEGWSTSIPPGGVAGEKRSKIKADVRKSLSSLPFEERRVLIDQGHKLTNAISETLAMGGGAIAGRWRSNWRQAGYDYREDHKERDNEVYVVRGSWAHAQGLIRRGAVGYTDEITAPGQEVFCRCYWIWLYTLGDLPADMLTAKGRKALELVRGREEVRSARFARADAAAIRGVPAAQQQAWRDTCTKREARYLPVWASPQTRCQRCAMFVRLSGGSDGNACSTVEGEISARGHCTIFAPIDAKSLKVAVD